MSALDVFSPTTRAWFEGAFAAPTPAQELGWPKIASGKHTLIQAPTGSGKTLAAFLYGIDRLTDAPGEGLRLLYVSPLKALNYDIERNLRGPLAGLNSKLRVAVRTGDTPRRDRLTGEPVQRVGLSATQRPLEEIGRFVSGGRAIELVDAGRAKELDLRVVVPLEDMREPREQQSIWPSIYPEILKLVEEHRSTIVFVNNRRLAERLALRLNELAEKEIARAHHGSLAREQRVEVEELLKKGEIPCLVATSSLELGIDMGAVDLVIQVESPKSVARAGHELGAVSRGRIFPKFRADLLESAVVAERMRAGAIEETVIPRNPLDVLAQQIVAICADEEISVDELHDLVRGAYNFADLSRVQLENVLDMLAGRYPSDEFAELRPRIVWDRTAGVIRGRGGARQLAVTNAGTIPDRGLAGAGSPGCDPVLEGRGAGSPVRAGGGDREGFPGARLAAREEGAGAADRAAFARRAGCPEPAHVSQRSAGGDWSRPVGPHRRRRALPGRDRRLARLHPDAIRRPRARSVVAGPRSPPARRARSRGAVALVGRRHRDPPARRRRDAPDRRADHRSERHRGARDDRARRQRAVRLAVP